MRQKKPTATTIIKMVAFLRDVNRLIGTEDVQPIKYLIQSHHIDKRVQKALKELRIVDIQNGVPEKWLSSQEPGKELALLILNYNLEQNPRTLKATPFEHPEFRSFLDLFSNISNELMNISGENKNLLEGFKMRNKENDFIYLAGQIASGVYAESPLTPYQQCNDMIVKATKDLFEKIKAELK